MTDPDGVAAYEAALVNRLVEGDPEAWVRFVDDYGPRLRGMVRRMASRRGGAASDADVDEIVAEVFLALLRDDARRLREYDATYPLATWLGVLARTALGRRVRRRRPRPDGVPDGPEEGPAVEAAAEEREEAARVERALAALGDRDRLLLRLRFRAGLEYAAIARILGIEASSVGPLLARAKARLRAHLEEGDEGPVRSSRPGG